MGEHGFSPEQVEVAKRAGIEAADRWRMERTLHPERDDPREFYEAEIESIVVAALSAAHSVQGEDPRDELPDYWIGICPDYGMDHATVFDTPMVEIWCPHCFRAGFGRDKRCRIVCAARLPDPEKENG